MQVLFTIFDLLCIQLSLGIAAAFDLTQQAGHEGIGAPLMVPPCLHLLDFGFVVDQNVRDGIVLIAHRDVISIAADDHALHLRLFAVGVIALRLSQDSLPVCTYESDADHPQREHEGSEFQEFKFHLHYIPPMMSCDELSTPL